jgi:oxidoreductase AflX
MPTYALLGATGSTGSAVLRCLLSEPPQDVNLNILVRSRSKLLRAFPKLEDTAALRIRIVEGTSTDPVSLEPCLENAVVVFMCVGQNESKPGSTLCYDTATALIDTLKNLRKRQGNGYKPPTTLQLRTASLNPALARQVPHFVHKLVSFCLHYNYVDVKRTCSLYESAAREERLLHYIFVDPPTIHDGDGTQRTGHKLIATEKQEIALSYADLGAACCEIATRGAEFRNRPVGVTATGKVNETWGVLAGYLVSGAKNRILGLMEETASVVRLLMYCGMYNDKSAPCQAAPG